TNTSRVASSAIFSNCENHLGFGIDQDQVPPLDDSLECKSPEESHLDSSSHRPTGSTACNQQPAAAVMISTSPTLPTRRHTAYLDGLRGFAALMVYWQHYQLWPRPGQPPDPNSILESAYGYDDQYFFCALPGIRTFFTSGHFAVAVFFVISGYVLSTKPLSLISTGEQDQSKFGDNVASALFRRWLRLFLPVIAISFFYMTSWHAFGGIWTQRPEHQSTFRAELWTFYSEFKNYSYLFRSGNVDFRYNFPAWSIPLEFQGSIIVYSALVAFSRCTRNTRLMCQVGLVVYFLYIVDGWFGAMFMAGMILCDLDLLARNNELPSFLSRLEPYKAPIFYTLFILSIYLSGVPSHNTMEIEVLRNSPGWYYLSFLKPQAVADYKWFYLFWAAIFLVSSIPRIWWLRSFFELPFNQFLGRISFAFYLLHGPVLWILGDRLYAAMGWFNQNHQDNIPQWVNVFPLSDAGPLGLELRFLAPHFICLPLTLWLAEMGTRVFDEPSVKFAQWAYKKTLAPPPATIL
ncbi:hypothetical protein LOCC1_G003421, partial [Lachnellula occidentalis]